MEMAMNEMTIPFNFRETYKGWQAGLHKKWIGICLFLQAAM
jgi:hypothetical protein